MRFAFSPEQHELAGNLRDLLDHEFPAASLRAVWEQGSGHDPRLWARLGAMGVLGILVGEDAGGFGGSVVDAILLVEELGRAAVPGPIVETMTVGALALTDPEFAVGVAAGTTPITCALYAEQYVPHAMVSRLMLVADADAVTAVDLASARITPVASIDRGRCLSTVSTADGRGRHVATDLELLRDVGSLAMAAYLSGVSTRMLEIAGDHARHRCQFGQPIGSFQAVKHLMADALLHVEFVCPAIYRAAWSCTVDHPHRSRDVSMAKALASDAARRAARSALQVHGAIGYTWEHDLHLFMKKAWALIPAWGSPQQHRRRVADLVLCSSNRD